MTRPQYVAYPLIEGQWSVRFNLDNLPDLDTLMLDLAHRRNDDEGLWMWTEDDAPTRPFADPEPVWQWARISPCWCGEHGWHWDARNVPAEKDLIVDRPRGRFVAFEFMY